MKENQILNVVRGYGKSSMKVTWSANDQLFFVLLNNIKIRHLFYRFL